MCIWTHLVSLQSAELFRSFISWNLAEGSPSLGVGFEGLQLYPHFLFSLIPVYKWHHQPASAHHHASLTHYQAFPFQGRLCSETLSQTYPFFYKLLFVRIIYHSNRKWTQWTTPEEIFSELVFSASLSWFIFKPCSELVVYSVTAANIKAKLAEFWKEAP